jgi:hypothetical protein
MLDQCSFGLDDRSQTTERGDFSRDRRAARIAFRASDRIHYPWRWIGSIDSGVVGAAVGWRSDKLCPFPTLTIIPAFELSTWRVPYAALVVPTLLFFVWCRALFRGEPGIPRRSYALVAVASLLNVAYFIGSWEFGLHYQGPEYTRFVCYVNVAWMAALVIGFGRAMKVGSTFWTSLALHWAVFAWLAWYAFPYLGELP